MVSTMPAPAGRARLGAMKKLALLTLLCVGTVAAPAAASPTVRLTIVHTLRGCHVWTLGLKSLGPTAKLTVKRGTRLEIRPNCPMDFEFRQVGGPKLALGAVRTYAGTIRTIVFRKAGLYRLKVRNVQTPEERGLVTLGDTNELTLTIVVR